MDKRMFLKQSAIAGIGSLVAFSAMGQALELVTDAAAGAEAQDEGFWATIRQEYDLKPDYINLENGYYCIQPRYILDRYLANIREVNMQGAYYMRTVQWERKAQATTRLAGVVGCEADELIITRNTTESMDMVIAGLDWKPGDEAVMAEQDYGAMLDMFRQVAKRHGVVNKIISLPMDPENDDEIVDLYARAITPRTRLLMVCHMVNITGLVLPIRKICDMAHRKNVQVMVDGAHALAHLTYKIPDLHCDYYGASLHKWLSVPLGAGMLYVAKERIPHIWPLLAESGKSDTDILRLNHTGTHPVATDLTITDAIDFYQKIGADRKEARLKYLQQYWTTRVRELPHVVFNTPTNPKRTGAIANIGIKGMTPGDLQKRLLDKFRIYTVAIDSAGVKGCRITPNIYTTTAELDTLVTAIENIKA